MNDRSHLPSRREFVAGASAAALMAAHGSLAGQVPGGEKTNPSKRSPGTRIEALRLQTATPLDELAAYYRSVLELPILSEAASEFTVRAGTSRITFAPATVGVTEPFYHFAFNIPENKIRSALAWQQARGPIMSTPPQLRDPAYPDDVRHFSGWNAHSVFFLDPAGNVLEYIARHTLDNAAEGPFSSRDVLCVSEIAFVVDQVAAAASAIETACDLAQYKGGSDEFRAAGDENGLLLVFKRGREQGAGSGRERKANVFPTQVSIRSGRAINHGFGEYPYLLTGQG